MILPAATKTPAHLIALLATCLMLPTPGYVSAQEDDPGSLVSAAWLQQHLDDSDLVVLDCTVALEPDGNGGFRTVSGRNSYLAGHVPGAVFADLKGDLADPDSPLEYAVPSPERFAEVMGRLGVGHDTRVILYDAGQSVWAARVWWMLRWIGFDNAALLDGGLDAWKANGLPLSTDVPRTVARTLFPRVRPGLIADRNEVLAAIEDADVDLVDALPAAHFRGEFALYERPGHIPTAENVPTDSLVDDTGRFLPDDQLAALFQPDKDRRTINYCGGGIAASKTAFVMTRLGFEDVAVYTESLQEWAADPSNPLVVEPTPGDEE